MATLTFRDGARFTEEAMTVTAAAALAGVIAPLATGLPLEVVAPAAALFGGSVGAAISRPRPMSKMTRAVIGTLGGALAAVGFAALATRFGLGDLGAVVGGGLGGLALGSLLASDDEDRSKLHASAGMAGAGALGAIGAAAAANAVAYGSAMGAPVLFTSGFVAGLMGLWMTAGSGLRRIEQVVDPLIERAEALLEVVNDPVRTRVAEALRAYVEIKHVVENDESFGPSTREEAIDNAAALFEALLESAQSFHHIDDDLRSPRLGGIEEKLADLNLRAQACEDSVTLAHLTRAQQALRAQKAALDGLRTGKQRTEAAIDAQVALLDRLRLAVAQFQVSDRERFALEMTAVSDQVSRLTDDLDSLAAAMTEAEAFSDRRLLADVERAGRKALLALESSLSAEDEADVQREVEAELRAR